MLSNKILLQISVLLEKSYEVNNFVLNVPSHKSDKFKFSLKFASEHYSINHSKIQKISMLNTK